MRLPTCELARLHNSGTLRGPLVRADPPFCVPLPPVWRKGGGAGSAPSAAQLGLPGGSPHPGATQRGRSVASTAPLLLRSLGTSRGLRGLCVRAGADPSLHGCPVRAVIQVHTHIRVWMRFCRLPERGRQAFPWRRQRFSFPLPASVTRAPGAPSTRVPHFAHPCGSHPVQACPRPPVLGAGAAPRRGTGVCLWGEQEAATAVPLARPCVGTGCGGPNTPSPRLCPRLGNSGFVSVGLDLSFLRSQTWFCTYVSRI